MTTGINRRIALPLLLVALATGMAGCIEDETIVLPQQNATQRMFQRYVAMGNSLTAGYMSGGINDSTQRRAYPVLLAEMADMPFSIPSLAMPGCPPPLVGVLDTDAEGNVVVETDRVGSGTTSTTCLLRSTPVPDVVQNVAVPGAKMADAFDIDRPGNASNTLTTLINGGLSQVSAMRLARPTLVTSWLGNNDALGAALRGDTTLLTPVDTFEYYQERVAAGIAGSGTQGVALIGVVDIMVAPALQPGLYYWLADSLGLAPKPADATCAPTDGTGAPNPMSMHIVSRFAYSDPAVAVVSCDPAAPYVLTIPEQLAISGAIASYNNILQAEAVSHGWVYLNINGVLDSRLTGAGRHDRIRRCELLSNTMTPEVMVATFTAQCPHPSAPGYFGSWITYDGVHMSAEAHAVIAQELAADLNDKYDLDL